nr:prepilin-type N-terminal cleavage/methylation domain-containing protein [Acinetobacter baumannii]
MKKHQGFTLIELILSLALGLIITAAAILLFLTSQKSLSMQVGVSDLQDNANFGLNYLSQDIRLANLNNPKAVINDQTAYGGIVLTSAINSAKDAANEPLSNLYKTIIGVTANNLLDLAIDTNGASGSNGAFLNVAATVGAVDVHVGSIGVGTSGTLNQTTAVRGITETAPTEIISGLDLSLGQISANVQLGSTPQGAMIKVNSSLQGGLTLSNFGINDAAGGGKIVLDKVMVRGAGNTTGDLDVNADISVVPTGLRIQNNSTQGMNVYAQGVHLGAAGNASIGDLEIQGLNVGKSTITISGH